MYSTYVLTSQYYLCVKPGWIMCGYSCLCTAIYIRSFCVHFIIWVQFLAKTHDQILNYVTMHCNNTYLEWYHECVNPPVGFWLHSYLFKHAANDFFKDMVLCSPDSSYTHMHFSIQCSIAVMILTIMHRQDAYCYNILYGVALYQNYVVKFLIGVAAQSFYRFINCNACTCVSYNPHAYT